MFFIYIFAQNVVFIIGKVANLSFLLGKEGFVKGFNSPPYLKQKTLEDENNELKHKSNELPRCNQRQ